MLNGISSHYFTENILTLYLGQILSYLKINFTGEIISPNSPTTAVLPTMTHPILSSILGP